MLKSIVVFETFSQKDKHLLLSVYASQFTDGYFERPYCVGDRMVDYEVVTIQQQGNIDSASLPLGFRLRMYMND